MLQFCVNMDKTKVGIVILAAGESKRMGTAKQLLPIFGVQMLKYLILQAFETNCHPITVVVGANKDKIVPLLKDMPIVIIDNPNWKKGMGDSIKMGMIGSYMASKEIEGLLIMTSDMPYVNAETINKMIDLAVQNEDKSIVASKYDKTVGVPVLFKKEKFELLLDLKGNIGARDILKKHKSDIVIHEFENGKIDLDTKEDYFSFIQSKN